MNTGLPGIRSTRTAEPRRVRSTSVESTYQPSSIVIAGTLSRDAGNTGDVHSLRAGKVMGRTTSGGKFRPAIFGVTAEAIDNTETVIDISAGLATELARQLALGNDAIKFTGPPTAAGTVRSVEGSIASVGATTVTLDAALGTNEVQTINFGAAATGGTFKIGFTLASGAVVWTDTIAWSATDATFLASMNTAIDGILGAGLVVATAIAATDTDLGFKLTFSGAGYTALPQSLVQIDAAALTSVTTVTVTRTTTGVDGRFVTGSFIQPADGAETPRTILDDGYPIKCTDEDEASEDQPLGRCLIAGHIDSSQVIDWPADTALKAWLVAQLRLNTNLTFDHLLVD